jgi:hypothetical protein
VNPFAGWTFTFEKSCITYLTDSSVSSAQVSLAAVWKIVLVFGPYYEYITKMDNIYKEGTFITAKSDPNSKLIINRYIKRIYYCKAVSDPSGKLLAYFERELITPV